MSQYSFLQRGHWIRPILSKYFSTQSLCICWEQHAELPAPPRGERSTRHIAHAVLISVTVSESSPQKFIYDPLTHPWYVWLLIWIFQFIIRHGIPAASCCRLYSRTIGVYRFIIIAYLYIENPSKRTVAIITHISPAIPSCSLQKKDRNKTPEISPRSRNIGTAKIRNNLSWKCRPMCIFSWGDEDER